jgi:hypothetical protein
MSHGYEEYKGCAAFSERRNFLKIIHCPSPRLGFHSAMSEESSLPSLYDLTYPDEESTFKPPMTLFFSPINYNSNTLGTQEGMLWMWDLNAYDGSYLLGTPDSAQPLPTPVEQDNMASHNIKRDMCYVLILPLLFLILPHLLTHPLTRLLIPGTASLLSLSSLIPFRLTLLISSLMLPPSQ